MSKHLFGVPIVCARDRGILPSPILSAPSWQPGIGAFVSVPAQYWCDLWEAGSVVGGTLFLRETATNFMYIPLWEFSGHRRRMWWAFPEQSLELRKPLLPRLDLASTYPVVAYRLPSGPVLITCRPAAAQGTENTHLTVCQARRSARERTVVSALWAKVHGQLEW